MDPWMVSLMAKPIYGVGITVIVGLFNKNIKNKEKIVDQIDVIVDLAIDHWCKEQSNNDSGVEIDKKIKRLSGLIQQRNTIIQYSLIRFRRSIAGDDFSDPAKPNLNFEDVRIVRIYASAEQLKADLGLKHRIEQTHGNAPTVA